jgi:hypothetical protein
VGSIGFSTLFITEGFSALLVGLVRVGVAVDSVPAVTGALISVFGAHPATMKKQTRIIMITRFIPVSSNTDQSII